jgi:hypothetical protein
MGGRSAGVWGTCEAFGGSKSGVPPWVAAVNYPEVGRFWFWNRFSRIPMAIRETYFTFESLWNMGINLQRNSARVVLIFM